MGKAARETYYGLWTGQGWGRSASGMVFAFTDPAPLFCALLPGAGMGGWRVAVMPEWGGPPTEFIDAPSDRPVDAGQRTIPSLETPCPRCKGVASRSREDECGICHGTGYEPTESGRMVLSLMRYHLPLLMRESHGG